MQDLHDALPAFHGLWRADDLRWRSRDDGLRTFRMNKPGACASA